MSGEKDNCLLLSVASSLRLMSLVGGVQDLVRWHHQQFARAC